MKTHDVSPGRDEEPVPGRIRLADSAPGSNPFLLLEG
jgi:hypothetical protein